MAGPGHVQSSSGYALDDRPKRSREDDVSQPEESQEKTSKTDDILLKPVLRDLDDLKELENLEDPDAPTERQRRPRKQNRWDEGT
jgi:hypothetical protein